MSASPEIRRALDTLPLGVTMTDAQGRIVYTNPADARMHGYTPDELLGRPGRILGAPSARQTLSVEELHAVEEWSRETLNVRKDGSTFPVRLWSEAIRDDDGTFLGMITVTEDISERTEAERADQLDALVDPLTGLASRTFFLELLRRAARRLHRHPDYRFAILYLDLDRFSLINESLGHAVGDELLSAVADRLRDRIRENDVAARIAGDEFAVLLDEIRDDTDATRAAERILGSFTTPFTAAGREVFLVASMGIALGHPEQADARTYVANATAALDRARAEGEGRFQVFDRAVQRRASVRLRLETDLRKGIDRDEVVPVYQPIVELAGGTVIGFEALARWRHADRGMISPAEFIPVAEETGLIVPVGVRMLRAACAQAADWLARDLGGPDLKMHVNVSVRHLRHAGFVDDLREILDETGLPARHLELEVTESLLMVDAEAQISVLLALRDLGVGTAIDDFGTGYSSLSYLQRFNVDTLKIDRSFLGGPDDDGEWEIVRMIISLAHTMDVIVVAEGVETEAQRERLRDLGCEQGQGYLFGKPLEPDAAERCLA